VEFLEKYIPKLRFFLCLSKRELLIRPLGDKRKGIGKENEGGVAEGSPS
jgi:hypothetical protein